MVEALLDGGAVFSLVAEEYLVAMINGAVSNGLSTDSKDWPLAGLQHWGADASATTVSNAPALQIRAIVLLRITLVGINGNRSPPDDRQSKGSSPGLRQSMAWPHFGRSLLRYSSDRGGSRAMLGGPLLQGLQADDSAPRGQGRASRP